MVFFFLKKIVVFISPLKFTGEWLYWELVLMIT